jgi:hypothetical protein
VSKQKDIHTKETVLAHGHVVRNTSMNNIIKKI